MADERDTLIVEQALEIRRLNAERHDYRERLRNIRLHLICIGGPFNDNKYGLTSAQLGQLSPIVDECDIGSESDG